MATNTSAGQHSLLAAAVPNMASCFASSTGASSPSSLAGAASCLLALFLTNLTEAITTLAARLTIARIIAAVSAFLVAAFLADCALKPSYPRSLPRVGYGDSVIATLRNWFGYIFYFNDWVDEGYNKVFFVLVLLKDPPAV